MQLTSKESEVLGVLATGLTDQEIALQMNISTNTVKTHLKSIYRKLKVKNRVQAIYIHHQLEK